MSASHTLPPGAKALVITRTFDAPRDLVWKAHSDLEHLANWWGPKGFTWIAGKLDFRPGGRFHYGMLGPTGWEMWGRFVYGQIEPKTRIEFIVSFSDAEGGITRAPHSDEWPLEVYNEVRFTEQNGRTTMVLTGFPVNCSDAERAQFEGFFASMNNGFNGTYDQLEDLLVTIKSAD